MNYQPTAEEKLLARRVTEEAGRKHLSHPEAAISGDLAVNR